ncbi:MAG TPA: ABC transporter ATP-binding protein [Bacillales bacterium]|nr:ABC transporter ATP-binding protein [Bacillales bacterium]
METVLELKGLTKRIGKKLIVDDLSFTIRKGEIFGLLGPNGAGKTTTIRMIVGLISKTGGSVSVNGMDTDTHKIEAMSEMGAIVENPEMYKFLTGYKNLKHFARMTRTKISDERIMDIVRLVELESAIHKKVKTYSLGMRQRLGVAQAVLHSPSLLILDEPTNGLDPQGIYDFREYLRKLTKEGISVLISSHLLSEMQLMCDRVAIIQDGRLINVSTVAELTDHSTNTEMLVDIEVDDPEQAAQSLSEWTGESEVSAAGNIITAALQRETIPKANAALVKAGIAVYGIRIRKNSLEDKFLEMTKAREAK